MFPTNHHSDSLHEVGFVSVTNMPGDIYTYDGNYVYGVGRVNDSTCRVTIINVVDKKNPYIESQTNHSARNTSTGGSFFYIAKDMAFPNEKTIFFTTNGVWSPFALSELKALDVSNPLAPFISASSNITHSSPFSRGWGFYIYNRVAVLNLAGWESGNNNIHLATFESFPNAITQKGLSGRASGITTLLNNIIVVDGTHYIYQVSLVNGIFTSTFTPWGTPTRVNTTSITGQRGNAYQGGLYKVDTDYYLVALTSSNPSQAHIFKIGANMYPSQVSSHTIPSTLGSMGLHNYDLITDIPYLYFISASGSNIYYGCIDVYNPNNIKHAFAQRLTRGTTLSSRRFGNYRYISYSGGLGIYEDRYGK